MNETAEQRQYRRAHTSTPAQCTLIDHPRSSDGSYPMMMVRISDISASGLRLDIPGVLGLGTTVSISFTTDKGREVTMIATVVRIEESEGHRLVSHGLMRDVERESAGK